MAHSAAGDGRAVTDEGNRASAALEDQARHSRAVAQPPADLRRDSERIFHPARGEVIEILKATNEGLDYTWAQREGTIEIIARWMNLGSAQAAKTYDSVRDTYSKAGIPTDEQTKSYIAMLGATAGLKRDMSPAIIFDFPFAAKAVKK